MSPPQALIWCGAVIAAVCCMAAVSLAVSDCRKELYFGLMGHQMPTEARRGVEDALFDINNGSQLLRGYELKYLQYAPTLDSKEGQAACSRTVALREFFTHIHNCSLNHTDQLPVLIGLRRCPEATEAVAELAYFHNLMLLSCASSVSDQRFGDEFPHFFQLLPSEVHLARVFHGIVKEYDWRRVALIVQSEPRYKQMIASLKELLSMDDIGYEEFIFSKEGNIQDVDADFHTLQERILVIASDSTFARHIICTAYKEGKRYPRHVFLTYGTYEPQWWKVDEGDSGGCTSENLAETLEFSLAAAHYPSQLFLNNASLDHEPEQELLDHLFDGRKDTSYSYLFSSDSELYHQCYDATVTLALALNRTVEGGVTNKSFEVGVIENHIAQSNFIGLSGRVHFDEKGVRNVTNLRVLQYRTAHLNGTQFTDSNGSSTTSLSQRLKLVEVATTREDGVGLTLLNGTIWPGLTPRDGLPVPEIAVVRLPVTVIFTLMNIIGLVFALTCLAFNIIYREKKLIRLTSPNLNYLLIIGTILMYMSGIVFLLPARSPPVMLALCFMRMWLLIYGYSCAFGTIVAKLGRVFYIFRNPQATKRKNAIQDWHLMLFVLGLVAVYTLALFLHITLEGIVAKFNVSQVPSRENPSGLSGELGIPTQHFVYECSAEPLIRTSIIVLVYGSLAIFHIFALYFAFQTRKVKVKGLNDAKYIAITVYATTTVIVIVLVASFTLSAFVNVYAGIYSAGVWVDATLILGFIFVPKMVRLYKDPDGDKIFSGREDPGQVTAVLSPTGVQSQIGENDIDRLNKKIGQMENIIAEYKQITGTDLTKKWMSASNGVRDKKSGSPLEQPKSLTQQISKVSFDMGHTNPLPELSSD